MPVLCCLAIAYEVFLCLVPRGFGLRLESPFVESYGIGSVDPPVVEEVHDMAPSDLRGVQKIDYTNDDVKQASNLQVTWQEKMSSSRFKEPKYRRVAVLLLSWDPLHDDLKVAKEVGDLKKTFEGDFNYEVKWMTFPCDEPGDVQLEVTAKISAWVNAYNSPENLLIIYYAGHGRPGPAGKRSELELHSDNKARNRFLWKQVERVIQMSKANIFLIFDCCHAGYLFKTRGITRAYEYLIATGPEETTEIPGPGSFTRALINSLKKLAKAERPFTSAQLASEIQKAPGFPEVQSPILSSLEDRTSKGLILFYPMGTGKNDKWQSAVGKTQASPVSPILGRAHRVLTLHFYTPDMPSQENIEELGDLMIHGEVLEKMGVKNIRWGGLEPHFIYKYAKVFTDSLHRRRKSQNTETQAASPGNSDSPTSPLSLEAVQPDADARPQLNLKPLQHQEERAVSTESMSSAVSLTAPDSAIPPL